MALAIPILSYVGSVDTSSSNTGNVILQVTFPSSIKALMFEYKYQPESTQIVGPTDLQYSGFVYPDAAEPAQSSNEGFSSYLLPLPVPGGEATYEVAVRVYNVLSTSSYTDWSNSLTVYRPPNQQNILSARYDVGYYPTDTQVFVLLDELANANPNIRYIASYYYVKAGQTSTSWETTGLLETSISPGGNGLSLTFFASENVSLTTPEMYIAINAVLPFTDGEDEFYSVSEISGTVTATQAEITAPVITAVTYDEDVAGLQSMTVDWDPPTSSFIPDYAVDHYVLEVNIQNIGVPPDANDWAVVDNDIPSSDRSFVYNINTGLYPQGKQFYFRIKAVLTSGTQTEWSVVASAVQVDIHPPELNPVDYLVYTTGDQTMNLSWTAPYNEMQPYGFNAVYDLYVSNGETTEVVSGIEGLTYSYPVPEGGLTRITNYSFYVVATLTSGIVTDPSNSESMNSFTYATAPVSVFLNWAVPDTYVQGGVDVSFTFTNPVNPGLGNRPGAPYPTQLVWEILGTNIGGLTTIGAYGTVPYGSAVVNYDVQTSYLPLSGYTYVANVYMQTSDTNSPYTYRNGASNNSGTIIASEVPFIFDIAVTAGSVSFKVSSNVVISPQLVLFYTANGSSNLQPVVIDSRNNEPVQVLENYVYTFSGVTTIPANWDSVLVTASNQAGVGYGTVYSD